MSDKNGNTHEFTISEVSFTGKRTTIYERKATRSSDGTKLTQLKALVDYINQYCIATNIQPLPSICLPSLPQIIDYQDTAIGAVACQALRIGIYDDPSGQQQPDVILDLAIGNVMVIGAAQTGKTMLLQTILRGVAEHFSPRQVSVYILDFGSKVLKLYEKMNHVGGVLTDTDDEKVKNFFKMMREEIARRKEVFSDSGISSYEAYLGTTDEITFPRILVMVDNLPVFKEIFQEYEDSLLDLCREGLTLGITLIVTAKQTAGLSYRYMSNFATRIAFNCTESNEYNNIFDRCPIRPQDVQGRGLVSIQQSIYEFQAFLPFDGIVAKTSDGIQRAENQRVAQVKEFVSAVAAKYGDEVARTIPEIPAILTTDYWEVSNYSFADYIVPIGLTYNDIESVTVDLAHIGSLGILGKDGFGKSNLVRTIMQHLQQNVFNLQCEAYLIDSYSRQLHEFASYGFVERLSIDCTDFEEIVQSFTDEAQKRMSVLQSGGSLDNSPLLLCLVQNTQLFTPGTVTKAVCDQLKQLLADCKLLKMCFIFSALENNGDYSASELVKLSRELAQYILLDDISNVKLFGTGKFTPTDLRQFKKPLLLGDGYLYNARDALMKIKLVKSDCEE